LEAGHRVMRFRNRAALMVAKFIPWLLRPLLSGIIGRFRNNQSMFDDSLLKMVNEMSGPDKTLFLDPQIKQHLATATREAFRQGWQGVAYDGKLLARSWGFRLADIDCDNIFLWHGNLDVDVPVRMGRFVADAIPNCKARFFPQDGHLSVPYTYSEEIWATMNF